MHLFFPQRNTRYKPTWLFVLFSVFSLGRRPLQTKQQIQLNNYLSPLGLVFTSDGVGVGVGVVIRSVELYDLVKIAFWARLGLRRLQERENLVVGVASRSGRTKPITKRGNVHCVRRSGFHLVNRKRRSHKRSRKKMETFWFFRLRFRRAYVLKTLLKSGYLFQINF